MHRLAPLAPLACGAACLAQSAVHIDVEDTTLLPGQNTTVTLSAAWPPSEWAMAGIVADLMMPDGAGAWSEMEVLGAMRGPGSTSGVAAGDGVAGIIAAQLNVGPTGFMPDRSNPIAFWRATFTAPADVGAPYEFDLTTLTSRFDVYIMPDSMATRSYLDGLTEGRQTIHVVPTPASVTLLATGALASLRRRR